MENLLKHTDGDEIAIDAATDTQVADEEVTVNENPESETEETPEAESPAESVPDVPDIERLVAEAEERGYKRGRNERIAELMENPSAADVSLPDDAPAEEPEILILNNIRPSIWD